MICPLWETGRQTPNKIGKSVWRECLQEECAWWDSKANFNYETKQFEGQCCALTLARLKISGGINTHPH
mgnify:CR=1 FL=1